MKDIFDWLREQFGKIIGEVHSPADVVWNNAVKMCIAEVDEAEAKWKEDCCEWKGDGVGVFSIETSCGKLIERNNDYMVCPYCGKRIKIAEVE